MGHCEGSGSKKRKKEENEEEEEKKRRRRRRRRVHTSARGEGWPGDTHWPDGGAVLSAYWLGSLDAVGAVGQGKGRAGGSYGQAIAVALFAIVASTPNQPPKPLPPPLQKRQGPRGRTHTAPGASRGGRLFFVSEGCGRSAPITTGGGGRGPFSKEERKKGLVCMFSAPSPWVQPLHRSSVRGPISQHDLKNRRQAIGGRGSVCTVGYGTCECAAAHATKVKRSGNDQGNAGAVERNQKQPRCLAARRSCRRYHPPTGMTHPADAADEAGPNTKPPH